MKRVIDKYDYPELNDARYMLIALGMPDTLYNPRCVMTLVSLAEVSDGKWNKLSEGYKGTHDIITYINSHYPNKAGLDSSGP